MPYQGKLQKQFQFKHTYGFILVIKQFIIMTVITSADPTHAGHNLCELLPVSALSEQYD